MSATGGWTGGSFAHEALIFDEPAQLIERVVPFLDEALARHEPIVVVVAARTAALVRKALGGRVGQLAVFEVAERWWRGDAYRTLAAYAAAMAPLVEAGRPWRLVGEPVWLSYLGGHHWSRLESACNQSFAALPYYSLCLHDRRRLGDGVLSHVRRTHPTTWYGGGVVPERRFEPPAAYLAAVERPWYDPPAAGASVEVTSPVQARAHVAATANGFAGDPDLVGLATSELATNALIAAPACRVTTWDRSGELVVEVADRGPGFDATLAGYVPPATGDLCGRGLWIVRQITADLTVRSGAAGTTARAYFRAA